ncbi:hypothetical protein ADK53_09000 [Streptomyces sp. WM6373]|nr:hypothetical protein VR43_19330 [Streptomyces sp. NRRL S-104]KOU41431.1 hypothetical protein ADK53_09000 [Streptomyces sp. WM6373]KOU71358.1 hypothetical protein ADK96_06540 [Streptomyces sp. IGB124]KOU78941.1 hypothetical protein ADK93_35360 [Streptomyces sp. XY58]KOU88461.1 hypothetical protein ADK61_03175 [Streptomyces sp. XY66]KOV01229.1 hypothetical protein ADK89_32485 [Streptomyces sp. XY37]KOV14961.1 hypothetical protein ADK90_32790 [Streptomyces sp. XY413]KOV28519.1 hypothetical p
MGPWEQKEGLRARISELEAILDALLTRALADPERRDLAPAYGEKAVEGLRQARSVLEHHSHPRVRRAAHLGVAQSHVDTALNLMVWMASGEDIQALLPQMLALIDEHFAADDPRRIRAAELARKIQHDELDPGAPAVSLTPSERAFLAETVSRARRLLRRETLRVRSFVWIVASVTGALFLAATLVAVLTFAWKNAIPLCFTPESGGEYEVVCPSNSTDTGTTPPTTAMLAATTQKYDYIVVETVGVVAAAIASAATLRRIRGTALPYNVPVVLALLKLPTGALTAPLGLLLMRGGFVPGLSALDSTAQIIAWAIIFGYSQQLFTKFVDSQGQAVLDAVRGPNGMPTTPQL